MTWAEALAVFNFITWFLPIVVRSYVAWRFRKKTTSLSQDEIDSISKSIKSKNIKFDIET